MKSKIIPPDNDFQIRCPKLGHPIYFSYCRHENLGTPCFKTLDCWFSYFPVAEFLREELSQEEWENAFEKPPKNKLLTLVELIEKIKKENSEGK